MEENYKRDIKRLNKLKSELTVSTLERDFESILKSNKEMRAWALESAQEMQKIALKNSNNILEEYNFFEAEKYGFENEDHRKEVFREIKKLIRALSMESGLYIGFGIVFNEFCKNHKKFYEKFLSQLESGELVFTKNPPESSENPKDRGKPHLKLVKK